MLIHPNIKGSSPSLRYTGRPQDVPVPTPDTGGLGDYFLDTKETSMLGKLPGLLLGLRLDGECRPFMEMQIPLYLLLPKILPETTLYRHRLHPTRSGGASGGEGPRTIYPSRGLYEDRWVGRRDWEGVRHQWSKREKLLTFLWTHPKGHKSRFDWRLCTIYKRRLETSRKPSINVCVP